MVHSFGVGGACERKKERVLGKAARQQAGAEEAMVNWLNLKSEEEKDV